MPPDSPNPAETRVRSSGLLPVVAALGALGFGSVLFVSARGAEDAQRTSVSWSAAAALQLAAAHGGAGAEDNVARALSAAATLPGIEEATLVDAAGRITASTRRELVGRQLAQAIPQPAVRAPSVFPPGSPEAGSDHVVATAPLSGGGFALVRVVAPRPAGGSGPLLALALGLALALLIVRARTGRLLAPLRDCERALARLAAGDTNVRLAPEGMGAFAGLGRAVNLLADDMTELVERVGRLMHRIQRAPTRIAAAMEEIALGSESQTEAVEETASLMANINTSIRGINTEVDGLSRSAEDASSSVLQMGCSIEEVARNAATLHESVDASTSSIHEMGASIRQVAASADAVLRMAEETASSMAQMDRTLQEVGEHVHEASSLTQRVSDGAEQGSEAVAATIEGIEEIRSLTRGAKDVLDRLAERIHEIGQIVTVIGGINDETNLLSLNAAIIAAQAGEQGKAFAVVANHVKTLAQRTTSSTQEIDRLIRAVQAESENARHAMAAGIESVEVGVARSSRAGEALHAIRGSAREASARVGEIARASREQVDSSKHVAEAALRTSGMVQQITAAIGEQSRVSERMRKVSEGALEICRQVHRSTSEQKETAKFIATSITSIGEWIRSIQENTASHARASESVSEAVTRILDSARTSSARIPDVLAIADELRGDADALSEEVGGLGSGASSRAVPERDR